MSKHYNYSLFLKRFLTILFFAIIHLSVAQQNEKTKALKMVDSASRLLDDELYQDALKVNSKAKELLDTNEVIDTTLARVYRIFGAAYLKARKIDSAAYYSNKALRILNKNGLETKELGLVLYILGTVDAMQNKHESALDKLGRAIVINENTFGKEHLKTAVAYGNIAIVYKRQKKLDLALEYNLKALNVYLLYHDENDPIVSKYYNNIGNVYYERGYNKKAKYYYEKSVKIITKTHGDKHVSLAPMYVNLSNMYFNTYNYNKCIDYSLKSIEIYKRYGVNHSRLAPPYNTLGVAYNEIGNYEKALEFLEKSEEIIDKNPKTSISKHYVYNSLSKTYRSIGDYEKELYYLELSRDIILNRYDENYEDLVVVYMNLSRAYRHLSNYDKALHYAKKSLSLMKQDSKKEGGLAYIEVIRTYFHKEDYKMARRYLDTLSTSLGFNDKNEEIFHSINFLSARRSFLETLGNYYELVQHTDPVTYLDSLRHVDKRFIAFQDFIIENSFGEKTENIYIGGAHHLYEEGISHILEKGDKKEINEAFKISELVKSRKLLESFYKENAIKISGIPQELLDKDEDLNIEFSRLEKTQYEISNSSVPNDSVLVAINDKIFKNKQEREEITTLFKKEYPNYYQLIHDNNVVDIAQVQKFLKNKQSLVEYFMGEEQLFIFVINKDSYLLKKVEIDSSFNDTVEQLRDGIYNYWSQKEKVNNNSDNPNKLYVEAAYTLYNTLIAPVEKELSENVIIVPDGELSFIPFDALLTERVNQEINTRKLPYLLKKYTISYSYSATLLDQINAREPEGLNDKIIAFAPEFKSEDTYTTIAMRRNGLGRLKYNIPEVETISDLIKTDIYKSDAATKINFVKNSKNYKIIHLSTHAKANDTYGDYSYIAFDNGNDSIPEVEDKLYVKELYNLDLNADMVVLSACETGVGEIKKGEGVISLARAFTYAGAQSTVTSLWNVNDAQTSKLMELFYINIKDGLPKDKALHNAKLTYIENEELTAPYFWAAFIPAGNMEPMSFEPSNNIYILLGAGTFLLLMLAFFWYRKRT